MNCPHETDTATCIRTRRASFANEQPGQPSPCSNCKAGREHEERFAKGEDMAAKEKVLKRIRDEKSCNRGRIISNCGVTADELDDAIAELIKEGQIAVWRKGRGVVYTPAGAPDPFAQAGEKPPRPRLVARPAQGEKPEVPAAPPPPPGQEVTVTHEVAGDSRFDKVVLGRIEETRRLLLVKGQEYAAGGERFHNFQQGAAFMRCTPERALLGYMSKHLVSIVDMIEALDRGAVATPYSWGEKIGDAITYLHLLEAMVLERAERPAP